MPDTPPEDWTDSKAVKAWLRTQPREVAIALAARAALRVLPLVWPPREGREAEFRAALILPLLRATAAPWRATLGPSHGTDHEVRDAAARAADAADRVAADAAAPHAADAVAVAANANAASAVRAAIAAAARADARTATAAAAYADAAALPAHGSAAVARRPLWPDDVPESVRRAWAELRAHLLAADEGWDVWTDWYDARLRGDPFDTALETKRVIQPKRWDEGPAAVNAEIRAIIEERRRGMTERLVQDRRGGIFVEREGRVALAPGDAAVDPRAASMQPRADALLSRLAEATRSSNQFGALAETAAQLAGIVALPPDEAALRSFEMWSLSGELAQWRRRDDEAKARDDGFVEAMPPDLRQALETAVPAVALYARSFEDVRRYDEELAAFEGSLPAPAVQRAALNAAVETDAIDPEDAETVAGVISRGEESGPLAERAATSGGVHHSQHDYRGAYSDTGRWKPRGEGGRRRLHKRDWRTFGARPPDTAED